METEKEKHSGMIQIPFKSEKHQMENIQDSKIPPSTTTSTAKGNSDASNHYFTLRYIAELQDVVAEKFGPTVVLPNTSTLTENSTGQLPLSSSLRYPEKKKISS